MPAGYIDNDEGSAKKKEKGFSVSLGVCKALYLTTSKAVPQCPIDDAPSSVKGGSTPLCVIVGHGGMGIRIGTSQLLKDLNMGTLLHWVDGVRVNITTQLYSWNTLSQQYVSVPTALSVLTPYLLVWSGREHPLLVRVSGEVKGIGDHQLPSMEAGRLNKGQWPDPLHHCIGLWCHL